MSNQEQQKKVDWLDSCRFSEVRCTYCGRVFHSHLVSSLFLCKTYLFLQELMASVKQGGEIWWMWLVNLYACEVDQLDLLPKLDWLDWLRMWILALSRCTMASCPSNRVGRNAKQCCRGKKSLNHHISFFQTASSSDKTKAPSLVVTPNFSSLLFGIWGATNICCFPSPLQAKESWLDVDFNVNLR